MFIDMRLIKSIISHYEVYVLNVKWEESDPESENNSKMIWGYFFLNI